jgi:hypothetical protein
MSLLVNIRDFGIVTLENIDFICLGLPLVICGLSAIEVDTCNHQIGVRLVFLPVCTFSWCES